MKIRVYFTSGCSADFDRDEIVFGEVGSTYPCPYKTKDGRTVINAETVCFVRELPEKKKEGDGDE